MYYFSDNRINGIYSPDSQGTVLRRVYVQTVVSPADAERAKQRQNLVARLSRARVQRDKHLCAQLEQELRKRFGA